MSSWRIVGWSVTALVVSGCVALGAAEIPFATGIALATTYDGATSVAVADFDRDGDLDVVASAAWAPQVAWWENPTTGGGAWSKHTIGADLDETWFVATGDLDRDGDEDVVVASRDYDDVTDVGWYANPEIGSGTAWTLHTIANMVSEGIKSLALADFDRDGDLDVLAAHDGANGWSSIEYHVNDGASPPADYWDGYTVSRVDSEGAYGVTAGDVDGDGDLDAVAALYTAGDVRWYENAGAEYWTAHSVDTGLAGAIAVVTADLDRDGDLDLVASGHTADQVVWYEHAGSSWTEHTIRSGFDGAWSLQVADMDADGDADVLATARYGDDVVWFENQDGVAGDWLLRGVIGTFAGARSAAAADLDNDGDLDVVATAEDDDTLGWWENESIHRRLYWGEQRTIRDDMSDGDAPVIADLNRDGLNDVAAVMWDDDDVRAWMRVDVAGTLWWETSVETACSGVEDLAVGDLDGDGDLDLAGVGSMEDTVDWWENDGEFLPTWSQHQPGIGFDGAFSVEPYDLDRDGDLDLVATASFEDTLAWWENGNGAGTMWVYHTVRTDVDGAHDVAVGHLNDDGVVDIVAANYGADSVVAYLGVDLAADLWWEDEVTTGFDAATGVTIADVNSDGHPDIVATAGSGDEVAWWEGDGSGVNWTEHAVGSGVLDGARSPVAADLDLDGDVDVAAVGTSGDDLVWWEQTASGWTSHPYGDVDEPFALALGDLSSDGRVDVVVAAAGTSHGVLWRPDVGGQYGLEAEGLAPHTMGSSESQDLFALWGAHFGRTGDPELELTTLKLTFTDLYGAPLTTPDANALLADLRIYDDDGDMVWDAGDTLVTTVSTFALTADGTQTVSFTDGDPDVAMAVSEFKILFVVVTTTAGASGQPTEGFSVTYRASGTVAEDRDHDLVLLQDGHATDLRSRTVLTGGSLIFADDFHAPNTSAWSATSP